MQAFELNALLADASDAKRSWTEFLREPALSMGVYRLAVGQPDLQQPHTEDEVYYVVSGRARFRAGDDQRAVHAGTILFVERNVEHRFYDATEELTLLVFFAPAEHSLKLALDLNRGSG
jgi:mannose-6-phosphate isomerase-like protein (cupin superfamily)